jgi:hypothetical protein
MSNFCIQSCQIGATSSGYIVDYRLTLVFVLLIDDFCGISLSVLEGEVQYTYVYNYCASGYYPSSYFYLKHTAPIDWARMSKFYLKTETELSLRNVLILNRNRPDGCFPETQK